MSFSFFERIGRRLNVGVSSILGRDYIAHLSLNRVDDLERLGSEYGGWVIPTAGMSQKAICYCVGCGEDISFDLELIQRFGCDVYAFDPTPRAIEYCNRVAGDNLKYHFSPVGLWDKNETLKFFAPKNAEHVSHSICNLQSTDSFFEASCMRLSQIMGNNGHARIDILKLDIEGAEYRVLESLIEDDLDVRILCVEYDEYNNPLDAGYGNRIRESIRALAQFGYRVAVAEGNGNYTFIKTK